MLLGNSTQRSAGFIATSLAGAGCLNVLPMGWIGGYFQPDWVALVLIFWCFWEPERIGAGVGWCAGLLLDLLTGGILGRYALGKTIVGFVANKLSLRLRVYPLWQQCVGVAAILYLDTLTHSVAGLLLEDEPLSLARWLAPVAGMIMWPFVVILLSPRSRQHRYR